MNTTFIVIVVIVAGIIFGVAAIYFFLLSERLKNQLKQVESDNSESLQPTDDVKLTVDYTKTVEQAIADGNYDWKNSDVTAKNFPISPEMIGKKVDISGRLFHFDRNINSKEAIKEMDSDGCRRHFNGTISSWRHSPRTPKTIPYYRSWLRLAHFHWLSSGSLS